jgi:hypothetical protein
MVQTRRQYQNWRESGYPEEEETLCEECTDNNQTRYRANDNCKRHRKPDNEPKTEQVTTYRRRKPI